MGIVCVCVYVCGCCEYAQYGEEADVIADQFDFVLVPVSAWRYTHTYIHTFLLTRKQHDIIRHGVLRMYTYIHTFIR